MKSHADIHSVAVIGLGYVGLPLAVRAAEAGYHVIGIDRDEEKVATIERKQSPFLDEELAQRLKNPDLNFEVTTHPTRVRDASIVIICVPTPVNEDHSPDLIPLQSATESVAPFLRKNTLVIVESTVNPGVCEEVVLPALVEGSGLEPSRTLFLAHCPERINPGDSQWHVGNIPRVVGALDQKALDRTVAFYESIIDAPIHPMSSLAAAEAVKMVENSFRDINIAFVNELAMSFSKLGIDVVDVINGASTKPFAFMPHFPGVGVGGHCIPVDPYYLIEYGRQNGFAHRFLAIARLINNRMPHFTVDVLEEALMERGAMLTNSRIAVLGLSYKPDIDDCRESPAFAVIEEIEARGGTVVAYDPFVLDTSDVSSLEEALNGAKGVVVATAHSAFKKLTPALLASYGVEVLVDGRNCLPKETFANTDVVYRGIGRYVPSRPKATPQSVNTPHHPHTSPIRSRPAPEPQPRIRLA